jgi:hypothetical protein
LIVRNSQVPIGVEVTVGRANDVDEATGDVIVDACVICDPEHRAAITANFSQRWTKSCIAATWFGRVRSQVNVNAARYVVGSAKFRMLRVTQEARGGE